MAQTRISSPYSRFGIGDLHRNSNARYLATGGYSLGVRDPASVNFMNPASYSGFDTLSFVFEGGIHNQYVNIISTQQSEANNYISLGYLNFGIPITSWWKTSFGLLPFSNVGYNILGKDYLEQVGDISLLYEGSGGVNQFYWGHGFNITPKFSAGINASYLFGTLDKRRSVFFPDTSFSFSYRAINRTVYHDILLNFGIQYHTPLANNYYMSWGATYGHQTGIATTFDDFGYTFTTGSTGIEFIKDTAYRNLGEKGDVIFPTRIGLGGVIGKKNKWEAGIDYNWQNWESYSANGIKDSLSNSSQISAGVQFIPDYSSISDYWKKMSYRFGFRYESTYLQLKERQLPELGISFGVGLPMRRSRSTLDMGFEFGRRGTTADNLIQQNYFRFSLGVSVYERWFVKRRYD